MRKKWLFLFLIGIMIGVPGRSPAVSASPDIFSVVDRSFQVNNFDEKSEAIVPENGFSSDTDIQWDAELEAKTTKGKAEAYIRVSYLLPSGEKKVIFQLNKGQHEKGSIHLPKGHRLFVELYAGQYQSIISKSGVKAVCRLKIPLVLVKVNELQSLYGFHFDLTGPANVDRWVWNFSDGSEAAGQSIDHRFPTPGHYLVLIQGYRGGQIVQTLKSDIDVPDFVEVQPELSPLEGAVEFKVSGQVKLQTHYAQDTVSSWNFGDGTDPVVGDAVSHIYQNVGRHTVTLTIHSESLGRTITRNWEINARPMYIINQVDVTPLSGVIPLNVKAYADPIAEGSPMNLRYDWQFGDGESSDKSHADHTFTVPGDYTVTVKVWDENHPSIVLPQRTFIVHALPPVLQINPQANPAQGTIPLKVAFHPYLWTQGSPVNITFRWDFGDGSVSDQAEPEHVYTKPGTYNVTLVVKDTIHSIVVSGFLRVAAMVPQITAAGKVTPLTGTAPLTVNCTADPKIEGKPTELVYEWDFGDGNKAEGKQVSHAFNNPGTYTVVLTVYDKSPNYDGMRSTADFTVTVKNKA